MPRFACPKCSAVLSATEEQRGSPITCTGCKARFKVPLGKAGSSSKPDRSEPAPRKEVPPPKKRKEEPEEPRSRPRPDSDVLDVEPERERGSGKRKPVRSSREEPKEDRDDYEDDEEETQPGKKRKKEGSTVVGVMSGLGGLVLLIGFLLLITGQWVPLVWNPLQKFLESQGIPPILAIGITAGLMMIPIGIFTVVTTKSSILDAMPNELDYRSARLADFEDLDDERLRDYTETFEELGFRKLKDYTTRTDLDTGLTGFARLFYHPRERCFAEVNQVFLGGGQAIPMRCLILSRLEDGWSLATSDRQATKELYLMRRPRALWKSLPDEEPSRLLRSHLKMRDQMADELDLAVLNEGTSEDYFDHEKASNRERKEVVRKRSGIGIWLEMWLFEKKPRSEWLGSYARKRK